MKDSYRRRKVDYRTVCLSLTPTRSPSLSRSSKVAHPWPSSSTQAMLASSAWLTVLECTLGRRSSTSSCPSASLTPLTFITPWSTHAKPLASTCLSPTTPMCSTYNGLAISMQTTSSTSTSIKRRIISQGRHSWAERTFCGEI